jgi:hypothetical protein
VDQDGCAERAPEPRVCELHRPREEFGGPVRWECHLGEETTERLTAKADLVVAQRVQVRDYRPGQVVSAGSTNLDGLRLSLQKRRVALVGTRVVRPSCWRTTKGPPGAPDAEPSPDA